LECKNLSKHTRLSFDYSTHYTKDYNKFIWACIIHLVTHSLIIANQNSIVIFRRNWFFFKFPSWSLCLTRALQTWGLHFTQIKSPFRNSTSKTITCTLQFNCTIYWTLDPREDNHRIMDLLLYKSINTYHNNATHWHTKCIVAFLFLVLEKNIFKDLSKSPLLGHLLTALLWRINKSEVLLLINPPYQIWFHFVEQLCRRNLKCEQEAPWTL
jgi:hypothetical protein